jgi:hypothetical protein
LAIELPFQVRETTASMVSSSTKVEAASALAGPLQSTSNPGKSKTSFAKQLATMVEGRLKQDVKQAANRSHVGVRASEAPGRNSGESQFLVALAPRVAEAKTIGAAHALKTAAPPPLVTAKAPAVVTKPAAQLPGPQPVSGGAISEGDAYWNAQPAAVQALRDMPDDAAKEKLALKLANQGYSIDTQIMVWGWDPQMTMQVRENQGYSWVPSYGQSNVPVGPGISDPYEPVSYNPASPPPGSIQVSTAFAVGTIQNPLVQVDPTDS